MKPRDIKIVTVLNGWLVHVGCQTLVFTSLLDMLNATRDYLQAPKETQEKYLKESVNSEFFSDAPLQVFTDEEATDEALADHYIATAVQ